MLNFFLFSIDKIIMQKKRMMFFRRYLIMRRHASTLIYEPMIADTPFHNWVKIGSNLGENDKRIVLILH